MILGVESSCDDSSIAIFSETQGVLVDRVHTQLKVHEEYGGVVPALASREHMRNLPLVLGEVKEVLDLKNVTQVAVTHGPGLAGCLALGVGMAKAVASYLGVELVGVNHLRGHAFSPFIALHEESPEAFAERFEGMLPHLGLIASGGNTLLFKIDANRDISILAQTVDDAGGEALDKGGKLLGLPYPAGPIIEKYALEGNAQAISFPHAFKDKKEMKFSFSGLKTSLRYYLEKLTDRELKEGFNDICASYQEAVMQSFAHKTRQVLQRDSFKSVGLSGGIANNKRLRALFAELGESFGAELFVALPRHTTDNAAMVAFAAYMDPMGVMRDSEAPLSFNPSLKLTGCN